MGGGIRAGWPILTDSDGTRPNDRTKREQITELTNTAERKKVGGVSGRAAESG